MKQIPKDDFDKIKEIFKMVGKKIQLNDSTSSEENEDENEDEDEDQSV